MDVLHFADEDRMISARQVLPNGAFDGGESGRSDSDANDATVMPYVLPSCSVVTMVTPLAKCDIANLNCASSTIPRNLIRL